MTASDRGVGPAYGEVAQLYTELFMNELASHPYDRALADAFIERVGSAARVLDVGCGPGALTDYLCTRDVDACGVDLSQAMVDIAAEAFPDRPFLQGDMRQLDVADASLDGIVSRHSTIHFEPSQLDGVYAEFARVLRPGGTLLLWFFAIENASQHGKRYDHKVATAYRCYPDAIADQLRNHGLVELERELQPATQNRSFKLAAITATRAPREQQ